MRSVGNRNRLLQTSKIIFLLLNSVIFFMSRERKPQWHNANFNECVIKYYFYLIPLDVKNTKREKSRKIFCPQSIKEVRKARRKQKSWVLLEGIFILVISFHCLFFVLFFIVNAQWWIKAQVFDIFNLLLKSFFKVEEEKSFRFTA